MPISPSFMPSQTLIDIFNVYGGILSIVIGLLSVFISITFFVFGMRTESRTKKVLAEIKTQTDMLQQITAKQLDKLIDNSHSVSMSTMETMQSLVHSKDK